MIISYSFSHLVRQSAHSRSVGTVAAAQGAEPPTRARRAPVFRRFASLLAFWRERARQRRELAHMDERMLRDIGVNRTAAARECQKPFWRS